MDKVNIQYANRSAVAIRIANALNGRDRMIARRWIEKLNSYRSNNVEIAKARLDLMTSLIGVLRDELRHKIMNTQKIKKIGPGKQLDALLEEINAFGEPNVQTPLINSIYEPESLSTSFMSVWSPDRQTYIAAKPIGGEGALIYLAVTAHPEMGWDFPDSDTRGAFTPCGLPGPDN